MGHVNEKGLRELNRQGVLQLKQVSDLPICEHCILGKSTRVNFAKGLHCTKDKLEYIHLDLWGPERVNTHGGARYFLSIVDDYSRKVWLHFLKNKGKTVEKFKKWLTLVQNKIGKKVKTIRTNRGLEFVNQQFNELCTSSGIVRHVTVGYIPQQNGLAERMNKTILERVRCLLS